MCHYLCNSTISGKPEGPEEDQCHWNGLLSDNQKIFLSDVNRHAGAVTILMSMTVTILILSSKELSNDRYYRNLLNYSISASARAVVALVTYVNMAYSCGSYNYWDMSSCEILATVDTFLSVYEFESLTQLCIATFISAFYTVKEWEIPAWHNGLFTAISVVLGALYSAMPFLGIGRFKKDFDCIQCTYDVIMPQRKRLQVAITAIFLLKHVKPVVFMFGALWFARRLEVRETLLRTKGLLYAVIATVTFSLPIFLVRASVLAKQLFNNVTPESNDIGCYVGWAIFFNMIATPLAFIFLYAGDKRLSDYLGKITCRRVVIVKVVRVCTCTCVPAPASPAPGSPAPGSPAPGSPAPASPAPGSPAPGSPAPASPAPAPPAPASPAQLEQE